MLQEGQSADLETRFQQSLWFGIRARAADGCVTVWTACTSVSPHLSQSWRSVKDLERVKEVVSLSCITDRQAMVVKYPCQPAKCQIADYSLYQLLAGHLPSLPNSPLAPTCPKNKIKNTNQYKNPTSSQNITQTVLSTSPKTSCYLALSPLPPMLTSRTSVHLSPTLSTFRRSIKTLLFRKAYP